MTSTTPWRSTVDNTLKSTQETLDRLRQQQAQYTSTSRRLEDLFSGEGGDSSRMMQNTYQNDVNTIPPLPSSYTTNLRARREELPEYKSMYNDSAKDSHLDSQNSPWKKYNSKDLNSVPPIIKELHESYLLNKSQIKNLTIELELERSVRADQVKHIERQQENKIAELKAIIRQLQDDNAYLSNSVRALEMQRATKDPFPSLNDSKYNDDASYGGGRNGLKGQPTSQLERLAQLEDIVSRQQRVLDERQTRFDSLIVEMVRNKVEIELEKLKSVAREAGRDGCEELVKARTAAMQSLFNNEIQKVLESTGVSREIAETAKNTFNTLESKLNTKMDLLENKLLTYESDAKRESAKEAEGRRQTLQSLDQQMKNDLAEMRNDVKSMGLQLERKLTSSMEDVKLDCEEKINQSIKEKQKNFALQQEFVKQSDLPRLTNDIIDPYVARIDSLQKMIVQAKDTFEGWQKQLKQEVSSLQVQNEKLSQGCEATNINLETQAKELEKAKTDVDLLKQRNKEMETRLRETENTCKENSQAIVELETNIGDRVETLEGKVRPMRAELENNTRKLQEMSDKHAVAEERLSACEVDCGRVQSTVNKAVQPLQVKYETLHQTIETEVLSKMEPLSRSVHELGIRCTQVKDNQSHQEKLVGQMLSDVKKDMDLRMKETQGAASREIQDTEQRLLNQIELTEKKIQSQRQEIDNLWNRVGEGFDKLPSKDDVEAVCQKQVEKLNHMLSVIDNQIGTLASEVEALKSAQSDDLKEKTEAEVSVAPSPSSVDKALSPLKAERVDQLSNEIEAQRQSIKELEERLLQLTKAQKDSVLAEFDKREKDLQEKWNAIIERNAASSDEKFGNAVDRLKKDLSDQQGEAIKEYTNPLEKRLDQVENNLQKETEQMEKLSRDFQALKMQLSPAAILETITKPDAVASELSAALKPFLDTSSENKEEVNVANKNLEALESQLASMNDSIKALKKDVSQTQEEMGERFEDVEKKNKMLQSSVSKIETYVKDQLRTGMDTCMDNTDLQVGKLQTLIEKETGRLESLLREKANAIQTLETQFSQLENAYQTVVPPVMNEKLKQLSETLYNEQDSLVQPIRVRIKGLEERVKSSEENQQELSETLPVQCKEVERRCMQQTKAFKEDLEKCCALVEEQSKESLSRVGDEARKGIARLDQERNRLRESIEELETKLNALKESHGVLQTELEAAKLEAREKEAQAIQADDSPRGKLDEETEKKLKEMMRQDEERGAALTSMQQRLGTLEKLIEDLEDANADGLEAVADTLSAFTENLNQSVSRAAAQLLKNKERLALNISSSSSTSPASSPISNLSTLDDLFHFVNQEIESTRHAVHVLQTSAMDTVDVVSQLQQEVLPVQQLQKAVLQISRGLRPLAVKNGVDEAAFDVDVGPQEPAQLTE